MLDIPYLLSTHSVLKNVHKKKSSGERSGLRVGQGIGPPLPIQASGNRTRAFRLTDRQLTYRAMAGVPGNVIRNTLVVFPAGVSDLSLLQTFNIESGVHLATYWVVTGFLSPGIKQAGVKFNFRHHVVKFKNEWSCDSIPSRSFMSWIGRDLPYKAFRANAMISVLNRATLRWGEALS